MKKLFYFVGFLMLALPILEVQAVEKLVLEMPGAAGDSGTGEQFSVNGFGAVVLEPRLQLLDLPLAVTTRACGVEAGRQVDEEAPEGTVSDRADFCTIVVEILQE